MIASIGLFVLISIAIYIYTVMGQTDVELPDQERKQEEEQDYFSAFADTYALTEREQEVLKMLLASDEEVQEIANRLYISRAMLYRYISALNKKTDTNSRIGLIQFYYTWKPEKRLIVTIETYVNSRIVQFYVKLFSVYSWYGDRRLE